MGACASWAIISPVGVKMAVEQSARSLMPGENAVFTSAASISSAAEPSILAITWVRI